MGQARPHLVGLCSDSKYVLPSSRLQPSCYLRCDEKGCESRTVSSLHACQRGYGGKGVRGLCVHRWLPNQHVLFKRGQQRFTSLSHHDWTTQSQIQPHCYDTGKKKQNTHMGGQAWWALLKQAHISGSNKLNCVHPYYFNMVSDVTHFHMSITQHRAEVVSINEDVPQ